MSEQKGPRVMNNSIRETAESILKSLDTAPFKSATVYSGHDIEVAKLRLVAEAALSHPPVEAGLRAALGRIANGPAHRIVFGSPGPLYSAGWAGGVDYLGDIARQALSTPLPLGEQDNSSLPPTKLAETLVMYPEDGVEFGGSYVTPGKPAVVENAIGAAEREVGQFVYNRISQLMDTKSGEPEALELRYLADLVTDVEEYGATGEQTEPSRIERARESLSTPHQPRPPFAESEGAAELERERIARIIHKLLWEHYGHLVPRAPCLEDSLLMADEIINGRGDEPSDFWVPRETAFSRVAVPEGWALVPIEPTDDMKRAAFGPILHGGRGGPLTSDYIRQQAALTFWPMMIRVAPSLAALPPTGPDGGAGDGDLREALKPFANAYNPDEPTEIYVFKDVEGCALSDLTWGDFRRACQALASPPTAQPDGWRDIASAPRDGTHILVCAGPYGGFWTFMQRPPFVAHWWDLEGEQGFYLSSGGTLDDAPCSPTHWRPLPAPPASGGEGT